MHEKRFESDIALLGSPDRLQRMEVPRVVSMCLEGSSFRNVLDIGTGSGVFAEAFSKVRVEVAGVDVNPHMIAAARAHVPGGTFQEAQAELLPFLDSSFDLVFLGLVLHESDDPLKALLEARRVTRKRVCVLEWPYRAETYGPPLAHRIRPEDMAGWIRKATFSKWERLILANVELYRLAK